MYFKKQRRKYMSVKRVVVTYNDKIKSLRINGKDKLRRFERKVIMIISRLRKLHDGEYKDLMNYGIIGKIGN